MPKGYPRDYVPAAPVGAPATIVENQAPPFIFTGFQPLSTINGKNVASSFAKVEHQSWWTRRADDATWEGQRHWKKTVMLGGDNTALLSKSDHLNHSKNNLHKSIDNQLDIKINGSSNNPQIQDSSSLLINNNNSSDPAQRTIVIHAGSRNLRIGRASDPQPISVPNVIARKRIPNKNINQEQQVTGGVFKNLEPNPENFDTFTSKINAIRTELRSRMRSIKLRGITNGLSIAANSNADVIPLTLSEDQDPLGTVWPIVSGPDAKDIYIGEDALLISDAQKHNYAVRWPISNGSLNTAQDSGYHSKVEILADIEAIWVHTLFNHLKIKEQDLKEYSAIFILPDIYDHFYLREMVDLLFRGLGFKQICFQQESLCACFGAGLSTACIIDIGASTTSVSCVEEGWILPDTRIQLSIGGDDITTVLAGMLRRQNFPYKQLNLNCTWDWQMLEQLKEDMLVLSEGDVGLNSFTFFTRNPDQPTLKWSVRAYDEVIIPAMILFSPSIIEFDKKLKPTRRLFGDKEDVDDVLDLGGNPITDAMRNSTSLSASNKSTIGQTSSTVNGTDSNRLTVTLPEDSSTNLVDDIVSPRNVTPQPNTLGVESSTSTRRPSPSTNTSVKNAINAMGNSVTNESCNISSEAFISAVSKIPLHEATVQSILACGTEERSKRMASNIMIVGGGGLIHNVGYAISSRIQTMLQSKYPTIETVIIPTPRDVDPKILAWKGVSLICRIESSSDLWIRSSDWEVLGYKAIKDRTMFMC